MNTWLHFALTRLILVVLSVISFGNEGQAGEPPPSIIFDTDMGGDCDDVGALFILHGAIGRGEATLLATMGGTSSVAIAPCLDAINTWFGRPGIPVGTLKDTGFHADPGYPAEIIKRFPHKYATSTEYPDAVVLYRQILASQPDGSVSVVAVGMLRNLANLLKSGGDAASPLAGPALIAKKVKRLDIMGGKYPPFPCKDINDGEYNFVQDAPSAELVCRTWPTLIRFNGEGGSTNSGRRVTYEMAEHNPLTMAYRLYPGVGYAGDRLSWDPISTLVSIRGAAPWYNEVSGGMNVANATTGSNLWQPGASSGHSYLVAEGNKAATEKALEDLMVSGKGHPTNLVFNTAYYANAGMCQITSKGSADLSQVAIKAFDSDDRTAWLDKAATSWIQCRYVDGRKYRVTAYALTCNDALRLPSTVELLGSNDGGNTWTSLNSQSTPGITGSVPRREYAIASPAKWNVYRLVVSAANASEGVQVSECELNEAITCTPAVLAAGITIDQTAITIPAHGRATINASLTPMNTFDREVTWVSSNPGVADVRRIGEQVSMVVGKMPGTCTVTASIGAVTQTCAVTVTTSNLPSGWAYDELNTPPIPGAIAVNTGTLSLTGCGHAMTSWWQRVRDQGTFVSKPVSSGMTITARLTSLSPNVGGPSYAWDSRPSTAAGLMIRESLGEACGRHVLIQVDVAGNLLCRWRDKSGDPDDGQQLALGTVTLPIHLKLAQSGSDVQVFTSSDGLNWGGPRMTHTATFAANDRIGLFVTSGNTFAATTAMFDTITPPLSPRVNVPPVANGQSLTTPPNTAKILTLTGSDVDGDPLTTTVTSSPLNGVLSGTAPSLVYTPATGFSGSDSFTFTVNDGVATSASATISITVAIVPPPPGGSGGGSDGGGGGGGGCGLGGSAAALLLALGFGFRRRRW